MLHYDRTQSSPEYIVDGFLSLVLLLGGVLIHIHGAGRRDSGFNGGGIHGGDEDSHTVLNGLLGNRKTGQASLGAAP